MTEPELDDDWQRWPEDPYKLFGLAKSADVPEIRKAYHRLIRRFKPERAPAQFQRINEAYQQLIALAEYRSWSMPVPPIPTDGDGEPQRSVNAPGVREVLRQAEPARPSAVERRDGFWAQAINGQTVDAARSLAELCPELPCDERLHLQLFWLARLHREPTEDAVERLCGFLSRAGLTPHALGVLLRELDRQSKLALLPSVEKLVGDTISAPAWITLLRAVWLCWVELDDVPRIERHLPQIRERIVFDDPHLWNQVVLIAIEFSENHSENELWRNWTEVNRLIAADKDELDFDDIPSEIFIAQQMNRQALNPPDGLAVRSWFELACLSLREPPRAIRAKYLQRIQRFATYPMRGLEEFNALYQYSPEAVYILCRTSNWLRNEPQRWFSVQSLSEFEASLRPFLNRYGGKPYADLQSEIVRYCLHESLSVDEFLGLCHLAERQFDESQTLSDENLQQLQYDEPLKCLVATVLLVRL